MRFDLDISAELSSSLVPLSGHAVWSRFQTEWFGHWSWYGWPGAPILSHSEKFIQSRPGPLDYATTERSETWNHTAIDRRTRRDSRTPSEVCPPHSILVLIQLSCVSKKAEAMSPSVKIRWIWMKLGCAREGAFFPKSHPRFRETTFDLSL
jgi:hypothetical protein